MKSIPMADLHEGGAAGKASPGRGVVLDRVSKVFGAHTGVKDVSVSVPAGQFITMLGPSGCGKTTTLRLIAGLETNNAGRIEIGGRTVSDAKKGVAVPPEKRNLGMVFQSYAIWPHMTVFDNVAYPLRARHADAQEIQPKVERALRLVEMEAYASRPATALSGGQQQRVAIARALVFEPDLLLLDEPLSNLDARLRLQTGREFRQLQQKLGITAIYVTHDQEEAMTLSDIVIVMFDGSIEQIGTPEDVYQRPASLRVADFFGQANLVSAEVISAKERGVGLYEVEVCGSGWKAACLTGEDCRPGQTITIVVRPENMIVADEPVPDGQLRWHGKVVENVFGGARRTVSIDTEGQAVLAHISPFSRLKVDDVVILTTPLEATWGIIN